MMAMEDSKIEELFPQFLQAIKKNKRALKSFKESIVQAQQYELAGSIRDLEKNLFVETEEQKEGAEFSKILRMFDFKVSDADAWLLKQIAMKYIEKGSEFDSYTATLLSEQKRKKFELE